MSKWHPLEYKVNVKLHTVDDKTEGGLIKPDSVVQQEEMAQVYGTVTEMSEMAFTNGEGERWHCTIPNVGDEVMFAKYSGLKWVDEDGTEYRMMNDKDIVAVKGK